MTAKFSSARLERTCDRKHANAKKTLPGLALEGAVTLPGVFLQVRGRLVVCCHSSTLMRGLDIEPTDEGDFFLPIGLLAGVHFQNVGQRTGGNDLDKLPCGFVFLAPIPCPLLIPCLYTRLQPRSRELTGTSIWFKNERSIRARAAALASSNTVLRDLVFVLRPPSRHHRRAFFRFLRRSFRACHSARLAIFALTFSISTLAAAYSPPPTSPSCISMCHTCE